MGVATTIKTRGASAFNYIMKPHRKNKIPKQEFSRLKEIGYNYHKFLWRKFKRIIKTKRLHKK